jgi:hypothetical protein
VLQAQEQAARLAEQPAENLRSRRPPSAYRRSAGALRCCVSATRRTPFRWCPATRAGRRSARDRWKSRAAPAAAATPVRQRGDPRRQQTVQLKLVAFGLGERGALVQEQNRRAADSRQAASPPPKAAP